MDCNDILERLDRMFAVDYREGYIQAQIQDSPGSATDVEVSIPVLSPAFEQMSDAALMEVVNMFVKFLDLDHDIVDHEHLLAIMNRVFSADVKASVATIDAHSNFLKTIFGNMIKQLTSRPTVKYHHRPDLMRVVAKIMTCLEHLTEARIAFAHIREVHMVQWVSSMSVYNHMIWSDIDAQRCLDDSQVRFWFCFWFWIWGFGFCSSFALCRH